MYRAFLFQHKLFFLLIRTLKIAHITLSEKKKERKKKVCNLIQHCTTTPSPWLKIFLLWKHNVSINNLFFSPCVPYLYGCTQLVH